MLTRQRKSHILDVLKRDGQIIAKTLSRELGLSEDTIRRDLRELAGAGLLARVHGGALPASPAVANFAGREAIAATEKAAIGKAAARLVLPGQVIFIDGGTTAVQLARQLPRDLSATVITHSPSIAVTLVDHPLIEVIIIGGRLFKHSLVSTGAAAMATIAEISADCFFMGATGIHAEGGLTTGDFEEARIKRAIMARAAETIVLASREKLNTVSPYVIAPLWQLAGIVLATDLPEDILTACKRDSVAITRA